MEPIRAAWYSRKSRCWSAARPEVMHFEYQVRPSPRPSAPTVLLRLEFVPAIGGPGVFGVPVLSRTLGAVADRVHPAGGDAQVHQVLLGHLGAALTERDVVLLGAAFVAVA